MGGRGAAGASEQDSAYKVRLRIAGFHAAVLLCSGGGQGASRCDAAWFAPLSFVCVYVYIYLHFMMNMCIYIPPGLPRSFFDLCIYIDLCIYLHALS